MSGFIIYAYVDGNPLRFTDRRGLNAGVGVGVGALLFCARYPSLCVAGGLAVCRLAGGCKIPDNAHANNDDAKSCPPVPDDLVGGQGDTRSGVSRGGKRHNSGPLTPVNGGTGDADRDFDYLTGGTGAPTPGREPGTQTGENGITIRPGKPGEGPRIDIPGNGPKLPETLHY